MKTNGICPRALALLLILSQTVSGEDDITQCYPELGCFPNTYPWKSFERPVPPPKDPEAVGTRLYCYTRESKERYNINLWPKIELNGCNFNASRGTVVISHGFSETGNTSWMDVMKDNYLAKKDCHVILVDWGPGSLNNSYPQAVSNTRIVAAEIARLLQHLADNFGLNPKQLHLIGFSLGAQIMARVSSIFGMVAHITGLDPARPGYENLDKSIRLDPSDADFVDIIHTSATFLTRDGFGFFKPCGHWDIYVNKGYDQPGCLFPSNIPPIKDLRDMLTVPTQVAIDMISCSHIRSTWIYAFAIYNEKNCTVWARKVTEFSAKLVETVGPIFLDTIKTEGKCPEDICVPLGINAPSYNVTGIFQANTTSLPPYCG